MKKSYTKPQIVFDSFEMSQSIASCGVIANASVGTCGFYDEETDSNIFNTGIYGCLELPQPNGVYDSGSFKLCYDVPVGGMILFSS